MELKINDAVLNNYITNELNKREKIISRAQMRSIIDIEIKRDVKVLYDFLDKLRKMILDRDKNISMLKGRIRDLETDMHNSQIRLKELEKNKND